MDSIRMGLRRFIVVGLLGSLLNCPESAMAEGWAVSGALGGGAFSGKAASNMDLSLDFAGQSRAGSSYGIGFGVRLNFLQGEGVRAADWDQASEIAQLVRYAVYTSGSGAKGPAIAVALGSLGNTQLGDGAIVSGFTTALNADRHRVGMHFRGQGKATEVELLIDDIASPRIVGGQGRLGYDERFGGVLSLLHEAGQSMVSERTTLGGGLSVSKMSREKDVRLTGQVEVIGRIKHGAGLHIGSTARMQFSEQARLHLQAELVRTRGAYNPWRYGPLYEVEKTSPEGERDGFWARALLRAEHSSLGSFEVGFQRRLARPDLTSLRVELPAFERVQLAGWLALSARERRPVESALAVEARASINERTYVTAEISRRYEEKMPGILSPFWSGFVALGVRMHGSN